MSEWQPIETAPKNGTDILGFFAGSGNIYMVFYDKDGHVWWHQGYERAFRVAPTHWMPLPTPP